MEKNNLRNKRVLITGVSGFIGAHVAEALRKQGAIVVGTSRSISNTQKKIYKTSLLELYELEKIIRKEKVTSCIHLAADALVESGQTNPYATFSTNINSTLTILEAARKYNFEKVIITSSVHVYGKNKVPFREYYPPKPSRPYETSKACTDLIAQSYADTFHLPVVIPRFANIYGPGDVHMNRLIPKTINSILTENMVTMWGGDIVRDYLYIDDAVKAYIALLEYNLIPNKKSNRIFNFGSGNKITVTELVQKLITLSKKDIEIKKVESARPAEIKTQYISFIKAKRILKWEPATNLDRGLEETFYWYKKYLS